MEKSDSRYRRFIVSAFWIVLSTQSERKIIVESHVYYICVIIIYFVVQYRHEVIKLYNNLEKKLSYPQSSFLCFIRVGLLHPVTVHCIIDELGVAYIYRISNEFLFHTKYYETSCVFYIPEPLARGYKAHNDFHYISYGMKIHLRFFLSHELTRNEQITTWNILFLRIGTDDAVVVRFENKSAWCSVITVQRRALLIVVEKQKKKNIKKSVFWYNNGSKFVVWFLAYIHECVVIFFQHGRVTFRMRRMLCNVLS